MDMDVTLGLLNSLSLTNYERFDMNFNSDQYNILLTLFTPSTTNPLLILKSVYELTGIKKFYPLRCHVRRFY